MLYHANQLKKGAEAPFVQINYNKFYMAYDVKLAARISRALEKKTAFIEKKMFGGVAYMVGGHMFVGVIDDLLIIHFPANPDSYIIYT